MNGAEHYREAERLLHEAGDADLDAPMLARAQVHATLALAAATAANIRRSGPLTHAAADWTDVLSTAGEKP